MPKRRQESIASPLELEREDEIERSEMRRRIDEELSNIGEIRVDIPSRSRGRIENVSVRFVSAGTAVVNTDGGIYEVNYNDNTCTCPDHVHRGGVCRHMSAVSLARGIADEQINFGHDRDQDISQNVIFEAADLELSEELRISREYEDDNFFYSDNPEGFSDIINSAVTMDIPYEYENVLNSSNVTFGVEIEFVAGNSNAIANELYELGLCEQRSMSNYHGRRTPGKWVVERDASVTVGSRGGEIISPIMQDTPETWRQIEKVCEVAKRHGARVNFQTGGHVHIGAESVLDGKRQRWRRFFKMSSGFENVYRRLSGGEQGRFRDEYYARSSQSQSEEGIAVRMPAEGDINVFQQIIGSVSHGKYQMINIGTFNSGKKTIEFRGFNGTLTPGIIQANIKYAAGVINSAERSRTKESAAANIFPTEADKKRGRIINRYNEYKNLRNNEAIMATLDTVFSRKKDKEHILAVIAKNEW